jgi:hypothetical protein
VELQSLGLNVEVLTEDSFETPIQMISVNSTADAELLAFPGSPTIRIDGEDIYPAGAGEAQLALRHYPPDDALEAPPSQPAPGKRLIRRAVERARGWGHGRHD